MTVRGRTGSAPRALRKKGDEESGRKSFPGKQPALTPRLCSGVGLVRPPGEALDTRHVMDLDSGDTIPSMNRLRRSPRISDSGWAEAVAWGAGGGNEHRCAPARRRRNPTRRYPPVAGNRERLAWCAGGGNERPCAPARSRRNPTWTIPPHMRPHSAVCLHGKPTVFGEPYARGFRHP
jgi:hypothetical protein